MYSDFFDPPDDNAADGDKRDIDAGVIDDEGMDYSSNDDDDEKTFDKSDEKHSEDKDEDTSDDAAAAAADDDDNDSDVEQPPVKKTKHKLFADESVLHLLSL